MIAPKQRVVIQPNVGQQRVIVQPPTITATGEPNMAVTTKAMNLRTGPSGSAPKSGGLNAGTQVQVRCQKSWCQIPDGRWVSRSGLSFGAGGAGTQPQVQVRAAPLQTQASPATFEGTWRSSDDPPIDLAITRDGQQLRGSSDSRTGQISLRGQADGAIATFTGQQIIRTQTVDWAGQKQPMADGRMLMNVTMSRPGELSVKGTAMAFSRLN